MSAPRPPRTAIVGARVFDGETLTEPRTVVIEGSAISAETSQAGAHVVEAAGAILLPGLIDAHVHLHDRDTLEQLASYGVTTALDMSTFPAQLLDALRQVRGAADIRSPGTPAVGSRSAHAKIPDMPVSSHVDAPSAAESFVAARIAEGADYIKIVLEEDGPDEGTAAALVTAARARGHKTVVHAATTQAYTAAIACEPDFITHIPLGQPLTDDQLAPLRAHGIATIPTLTMMEGTAAARGVPQSFAGAVRSVGLLHKAGVPILAGTDANAADGVPFGPKHGSSLHHELELLVQAGLSTTEALRAATILPARHFGLADRGGVTPGMRADLVLVEGDPLADIRTTRALSKVWCAGIEHPVAS